VESSTLRIQIWKNLTAGRGHRASFLRYLIIGGAIFVLDFMVWITCVRIFGWDVRPSQVLSRSVGALAGFFGHKYFSFGTQDQEQVASLVTQGSGYTLVTIINIIISPLVVYEAIKLLQGLPGALIAGKLLAEVIMVVWTYILLRFLFVRGRPL
jgi:putative flippase GtrA